LRSCLWLLAAPLVAAGTLGGHAVGFRVAHADPVDHAHALEATGHGYLDHAPLVVGLALALTAVAVVLRVIAAARGTSARAAPPWMFAALPPVVYAVQEHLERLLHGEHVVWATALEPSFVAGLLLQIPFALAALLLARALAAIADAVGRVLATARIPRVVAGCALARPAEAALPRIRVASLAYGGRGPPLLG
jgi:hypothetical protein